MLRAPGASEGLAHLGLTCAHGEGSRPWGSVVEELPNLAALPLESVTPGRVLRSGLSSPAPPRSQHQPLSRTWQGEWGPQKSGPWDSGRTRPKGPSSGPRIPGHSPLPEHPLLPVLSWGRRSLPNARPLPPTGSISRSFGWGGGRGTDLLGAPCPSSAGQGSGSQGASLLLLQGWVTHLRNRGDRHSGAPQTRQCPGLEEAPLGAWWVQGLQCGGGHPRTRVSGKCG